MEQWRPEPLRLSAKPLSPDALQRHRGGGRRLLDDRAVSAAADDAFAENPTPGPLDTATPTPVP